MKKEEDLELKLSFGSFKKKWHLWVLIIILLFAFYLRIYHADYPVVGYHNWKEVHYLTEARNFARDGFFEHGFFIPAVDFPHISGTYSDPSGAHTDPFPMSSIFVSLFFMIFGPTLFIARFAHILLGLGTVVLMYSIIKKLFGREDFALVVALLTAIAPLFVFFSRQVQDINTALFLALLAINFYLIWRKNKKTKFLVYTALFMALSIINKYSFALLAVPIFFTFPFSKLKNKKIFKQVLFGLVAFLIPTLFWFFYSQVKSEELNTKIAATSTNYSALFSSDFWQIMKAYVADNYTLIGIFIALLGLIMFGYFYRKKFSYNFILWYIIGAIPWIFVMGDKLSGHNYHQYPIAPLIIVLISYAFLVISTNIAKVLKYKKIKWLVLLILFVILLIPSLESKDRMFDTQFIGLDVAGEHIKEHSSPEERILFPGHQSYGVLWHADRKGYAEIPSEEDMKYAEDNLNVSWIFIYQWGLDVLNKPQWEYIKNNYHLEQIAFQISSQNQPQINYLLLKKGDSFDNSILSNFTPDPNLVQSKEYEYTGGPRLLYYYSPP